MDNRRTPRESFTGKLPPQNLEAEQGVLGSIMLSPEREPKDDKNPEPNQTPQRRRSTSYRNAQRLNENSPTAMQAVGLGFYKTSIGFTQSGKPVRQLFGSTGFRNHPDLDFRINFRIKLHFDGVHACFLQRPFQSDLAGFDREVGSL